MSFPKVDVALQWKGMLQMAQESPSLEVFKNSLNNHIITANPVFEALRLLSDLFPLIQLVRMHCRGKSVSRI